MSLYFTISFYTIELKICRENDKKKIEIKFDEAGRLFKVDNPTMNYEYIQEKYLGSCVPTEQSDEAYIYVDNEVYQYLLTQPILTKQIYETNDKKAYLEIVETIIKEMPLRYYDIVFFHDWTFNGENNGFMNCLCSAYKEALRVMAKFKSPKN